MLTLRGEHVHGVGTITPVTTPFSLLRLFSRAYRIMEIQSTSSFTPSTTTSPQPQEQGQGSAQQHESNNRRIIVNYLPQSVTQEQFHSMFAGFGTVVSSHLMTDKATHASLCYGFVEYAQDSDALKAIEGMNGRQMDSKRLKVSLARPKSSEIMVRSFLDGRNFSLASPGTTSQAELQFIRQRIRSSSQSTGS